MKGQVDGIVYSHKRDEGLSRMNGMRNRQALKRKWLKGYHSRHCRAISSYSVIKHWYPSFLYTLAYSHSLSFSLFSVPISSPYMLIYLYIYLFVCGNVSICEQKATAWSNSNRLPIPNSQRSRNFFQHYNKLDFFSCVLHNRTISSIHIIWNEINKEML